MPLILAIEPDQRQASRVAALARGSLNARVVVAESVDRALAMLDEQTPDLVLTSLLLSPKDEAALGARLRELDANGTRVQTLNIPMLASASRRARQSESGLLKRLRRSKKSASEPEGCDPAVFAEQIAEYLERGAADRETESYRAAAAADARMRLEASAPRAVTPDPPTWVAREPEPTVFAAPEPDAVVFAAPEPDPVVFTAPAPDPVVFTTPAPDPVVFAAPEREPAPDAHAVVPTSTEPAWPSRESRPMNGEAARPSSVRPDPILAITQSWRDLLGDEASSAGATTEPPPDETALNLVSEPIDLMAFLEELGAGEQAEAPPSEEAVLELEIDAALDMAIEVRGADRDARLEPVRQTAPTEPALVGTASALPTPTPFPVRRWDDAPVFARITWPRLSGMPADDTADLGGWSPRPSALDDLTVAEFMAALAPLPLPSDQAEPQPIAEPEAISPAAGLWMHTGVRPERDPEPAAARTTPAAPARPPTRPPATPRAVVDRPPLRRPSPLPPPSKTVRPPASVVPRPLPRAAAKPPVPPRPLPSAAARPAAPVVPRPLTTAAARTTPAVTPARPKTSTVATAARERVPPAAPPAAPPSAPVQAPPQTEVVEMLVAIRRDLELLRSSGTPAPAEGSADRSDADANGNHTDAPTAPVRAARKAEREKTATARTGREKTGKKKKAPPPVQDEWGFFDPDQCGFAALLAKLDEITDDDEGS
jgi:CheY-like chemotaxis protein